MCSLYADARVSQQELGVCRRLSYAALHARQTATPVPRRAALRKRLSLGKPGRSGGASGGSGGGAAANSGAALLDITAAAGNLLQGGGSAGATEQCAGGMQQAEQHPSPRAQQQAELGAAAGDAAWDDDSDGDGGPSWDLLDELAAAPQVQQDAAAAHEQAGAAQQQHRLAAQVQQRQSPSGEQQWRQQQHQAEPEVVYDSDWGSPPAGRQQQGAAPAAAGQQGALPGSSGGSGRPSGGAAAPVQRQKRLQPIFADESDGLGGRQDAVTPACAAAGGDSDSDDGADLVAVPWSTCGKAQPQEQQAGLKRLSRPDAGVYLLQQGAAAGEPGGAEPGAPAAAAPVPKPQGNPFARAGAAAKASVSRHG